MIDIGDDVYVFDNIIDVNLQKIIENKLLHEKVFEWYYLDDVTKPGDGQQKRPGFQHSFIWEEKQNSPYHDLIKPIIINACQRLGLSPKKYLSGRSFLQLPLSISDDKDDSPHIDRTEDHIVVLYYVIDSDGETIIYNNKYRGEEDLPDYENLKEKQRVMPKQGRVIVFKGNTFHAASQPKKGTRCIINYNVSCQHE